MISIIVPAHNEEACVAACVKSLLCASRSSVLSGEAVQVLVVLDNCTDNTEKIALRLGAATLAVGGRNVGQARAAGARTALQAGARWLAFTDCDTVVAPDWLAAQMALHARGADAVCGTVSVGDWASYGQRMRQHFAATYFDVDGHRHVHGANLGVSAAAYVRSGGFRPLRSSEDVALVTSLQKVGAAIVWSATPRVITSARLDYRAPGGFGATLLRIEEGRQWVLPKVA